MKIGLIIGSGTGRELAEIFKNTLMNISKILGEQIDVIECEHEFHSYNKIHKFSFEQIEKIVQEEIDVLSAFYKEFYSSGGRIIFKTAINAETLYLFRKKYKTVKIIQIPIREKKLLIIRDETQGYYSNNSYKIEKNKIEFAGSFRRENFEMITNLAENEAKNYLNKSFKTWFVYKHHLFANIIEKWVSDILPNASIYQPNNATDLLDQYSRSENCNDLLLITGNEVGDFLHEALIFNYKIGNRHTLFSKNIYLHSDLKNLIEYQTVHGSADDIAGKNVINPTATLRALSEVIELGVGIKNFSSVMNRAIKDAFSKFNKKEIPIKTDDIVNHVNQYLKNIDLR